MIERRPRQYADEFMKLESQEEKQHFAQTVPEHLRPLVKEHIVTARAMAAQRAYTVTETGFWSEEHDDEQTDI